MAGLLVISGCSSDGPDRTDSTELHGDLEPLASSLTYHTPDYHVHLRQVLMARAPNSCDLQFLVFPSFQPETLLSIYQDSDGYEAQVLIPSDQVWAYEGAVSAIECKETKKRLPTSVAGRLRDVWKAMLLRTKYNESPHLVLDGVGYAFIRQGDWVGRSGNPKEGTRPFVLAGVGETVVAYVQAEPAEEKALLTKMSKSLALLEASLATK